MTRQLDPAPTDFACTRTCRIGDFPGCHSVADWQQAYAWTVYDTWREPPFTRRPVDVLCVNWSGCEFQAPGDNVTYRHEIDGRPHDICPDVILALSVVDRIEAPVRFARQYAQRLAPGGLFLLTFAYWNSEGEDCAIGYELRKRIYNRQEVERLIQDMRLVGMTPHGRIDWQYHGHLLGDHTLYALALRREA